MSMLMTILSLIAGIVLVLIGADKLTDGATGLARRFKVAEIVIGLTVVAFGTSLPELVTSFMSTMKGSSDLSIGNVVGSNIFNALAIIGCSALVCPIVISKSTIQKDIPFAILSSLVLIVISFDVIFDGDWTPNYLSRTDGLVMLGYFCVFMAYTFFMARSSKDVPEASEEAVTVNQMSYLRIFLYIILGLAGLVFGGNLFVEAACDVAAQMGISESVIGLTIVAAGTSLPELATSVVAARKGSSAIAIGNVVGSNIFNILFILGFCATISPMKIGNIAYVDFALLLISILFLWFFCKTKRTVERWEGVVLILVYIAYVAYLVYNA